MSASSSCFTLAVSIATRGILYGIHTLCTRSLSLTVDTMTMKTALSPVCNCTYHYMRGLDQSYSNNEDATTQYKGPFSVDGKEQGPHACVVYPTQLVQQDTRDPLIWIV